VTSTIAGNYNVNVTGTSGQLVRSAAEIHVNVVDFRLSASPSAIGPVNVDVSANSTILVIPEGGFSGPITLAVSSPGSISSTLNATSVSAGGAALLKVVGSTVGTFTVNVIATSGTLSHTLSIQVTVVDFGLSESQTQLTVFQGYSGSVPITLTSDNGFTGSISLGATVKTGGTVTGGTPVVTFSSPTVVLASGGSQSVAVIVSVATSVLPNVFTVNVTASNGGKIEHVAFQLTVPTPKFSIVSAPVSVTVGPGATGSLAVKLSSTGGFNGTVSLSLPSLSGVQCSLGSASLKLVTGGSNTTGLSCTGSVGSYNVTITGKAPSPIGPLTLYGYAGVVVVDFSLSSTPAGILINTTQAGHASITISWPSNYNGNVSLQIVPVSGLNASLSASSVTGSGSVTLNVVSNTANVYTLIVKGTSGPSSHSVTLTVTVQAIGGTSTIFGVDSTLFYSGVGLLIAAVVAGVLLVSRRGKGSKK